MGLAGMSAGMSAGAQASVSPVRLNSAKGIHR